jgi:hypothetical protein
LYFEYVKEKVNTLYTNTLRDSLLKVFQMKIPQYNFLSGVVVNIQCIKLVIINLPKAINQVRDLKSKGLKQKSLPFAPGREWEVNLRI